MHRKLLFIDCETGGRDANVHAICSLGAVILHEGFVDETYYSTVSWDPGEHTEEARAVHRLSEADLAAGRSPSLIVEDLEQMFLRHDMRLPRRVVIGAHNADFDISFLKRLYRLAGAEYDVRFERRYMDTQALAYALEQAGQFRLYGPASLENICKATNVPFDRSGAHHAGQDAVAAGKAWSRMVQMVKNR